MHTLPFAWMHSANLLSPFLFVNFFFWIPTIRASVISLPIWHMSHISGLPSSFTSRIVFNCSIWVSSKPFKRFLDKSNICQWIKNIMTNDFNCLLWSLMFCKYLLNFDRYLSALDIENHENAPGFTFDSAFYFWKSSLEKFRIAQNISTEHNACYETRKLRTICLKYKYFSAINNHSIVVA